MFLLLHTMLHSIRSLSLFLSISLCSSLYAQNPYYHTESHYQQPDSDGRERVVDMKRMKMQLSFVPTEGVVKGKVNMSFLPLRERVDSIVLDAVRMNVSEVMLDNGNAKYSLTDSTLTVYCNMNYLPGFVHTLSIRYECTPRKGMHFTGWQDVTNRTRKQIWTQGQAFDNRYWCPMYDYPNDKMITETSITFDKDYQVLSNGLLLGVTENKDGTKTWDYSMIQPHATYLVMIAIGKYAVEKRESKNKVPINLWYYPEYKERVEPTYRYTSEMLDMMEELTGIPYPWGSYSQVPVQDYTFGAMENTSATVFGDFSLTDSRGVLDRNYMRTNIHELTHQWFGDYITQRNEKSIWLHESFATFYPKLFFQRYYGEDYYQWMRREEQNSAIAASEKDRLPIVHPNAGNQRVYAKGSTVLDMLKYVTGEKEFHRAIHSYLKRHAFASVSTNDLYQAFVDETGMSLDWFFDEWLYRGGEPWYKVGYQDVRDNEKGEHRTEFYVEQTQICDELTRPFKMPIVFEVFYTDGTSSRLKAWVEKQQERVILPNKEGKRIAFALFDPGSYITKKVEFTKSFAELKAQALGAPQMIDRFDAVKAINNDDSTFSKSDKEQLMKQVYEKEKFHLVRSEAVLKLLESETPVAMAVLRKAITDPDVEVRKTLINNTKKIPQALKGDYEKLLADSSYAIIESALQRLCDAFPSDAPAYIKRTAAVKGPHARVHIKNCELRGVGGDSKAIDTLVDYASNGFEFTTRQNAFNALKRLNACDARLVASLVDAALSQNNRLASAASSLIEYFMQQTKYRELFLQYRNSREWKKWQEKIIEKIIR